jgi:hypothetical protein
VSIDGKKVADGKPGPMTSRLREIMSTSRWRRAV